MSTKSTHKRKVNKRHRDITQQLWSLPKVVDRAEHIKHLTSLSKEARNSAEELQVEAKNLVSNSPPVQTLLEDLSIKSLKDSIDIDHHGKLQKTNFFELLEVNKLKYKVHSLIEKNESDLRNIRIDQIEVLQLQVEKLLEILDNNPDEK